MGNIHKRAHRDLAFMLSDVKKFGDKIELISPLGVTQEIIGSVVYSQAEDTVDGLRFVKNNPIVTIEIAELVDVPQSGERWIVRIPISKINDTKTSFTMSSKPILDMTFGIITLKLNKVEQS